MSICGLLLAGCGDKGTEPPPPVPTIDLTGYFVLPDAGYLKFFSDGSSQDYLGSDTVNGFTVVDMATAGQHVYLRNPDRAWVGTLNAGDTLYLLNPPLAAIPEQMPSTQDFVANSQYASATNPLPVRLISRLQDTGLTLTVPAGTFDSVALIRQEFWKFYVILGQPETRIDSVYRWYAPGVDEIRRVQWLHGEIDSTLRDFTGGTVGGNTYP